MTHEIKQRTTKVLRAYFTDNGEEQDLRDDTITLLIKKGKFDSTANAVLVKEANVTTYGEDSIAYWLLTPTDTDIPEGEYFFAISRVHSGNEYVPIEGKIRILHNLFD
jgi:hypothetical protein